MTVTNPLPASESKMKWWEKWLIGQTFGADWTTKIWNELVDAAKTAAAGGQLTIATATTYINENLETIIGKIKVGNEIEQLFESAAEPALIALIDSSLTTVINDVVAYVNELQPAA